MSQQPFRVLGIDPSTTAAGWAVDEENRIIACGTVRSLAKDSDVRALEIAHAIGELFPRFWPDDIVSEDAIVGVGPNTAVALGDVRGAIRLALWLQSLRRATVTYYAVSQWRRIVGFSFAKIPGEKDSARAQRLKTSLILHAGKVYPDTAFSSEHEAEAGLVARARRLVLSDPSLRLAPKTRRRKVAA